MPDNELDQLRAVLTHAHDSAAPGPRNIFRAVKEHISARIKKKAIAERVEGEKKTNAA